MINTVPHIAVVLHVTGDPQLERDAVFWTEACNIQMREHIAPAWGDFAPAPGVFFYGTAEGIPANAAGVVGIFRDAYNPDAAGYHAVIGDLVFGAVDLSRSSNPSRTLSHECAEIFGNAWLDRWVAGPVPGRFYAQELGDPTQRIEYEIEAEVLGERRRVVVSDFVTPEWFDLPGPNAGRRNFCRSIRNAFEIAPGGYQIAREDDNILYLPARNEGVRAASITRPLSRTKLISDGVVVARKEATP